MYQSFDVYCTTKSGDHMCLASFGENESGAIAFMDSYNKGKIVDLAYIVIASWEE